MSQPDEVQGVVEIKVAGAGTAEELSLHHLSGDEAATLADLFFPAVRGVGTLRSVTLLAADAQQAEALARLLRQLDVPALRKGVEPAGPSSSEGSFFAALRCILETESGTTPSYGECREQLVRVLTEEREESWLSMHARRALAWLDHRAGTPSDRQSSQPAVERP